MADVSLTVAMSLQDGALVVMVLTCVVALCVAIADLTGSGAQRD
jgi:hypothetical protein